PPLRRALVAVDGTGHCEVEGRHTVQRWEAEALASVAYVEGHDRAAVDGVAAKRLHEQRAARHRLRHWHSYLGRDAPSLLAGAGIQGADRAVTVAHVDGAPRGKSWCAEAGLSGGLPPRVSAAQIEGMDLTVGASGVHTGPIGAHR